MRKSRRRKTTFAKSEMLVTYGPCRTRSICMIQ